MSQTRRFFATKDELRGDRVTFTSEYHHMTKVLRARVGDTVTLCFGDGYDTQCTIISIDNNAVHMNVVSKALNTRECDIDITLYAGCLKGGNTEFVVQKAVELGVNRIVLFSTQYTVSTCDKAKIERLCKISVEASKQCGRAIAVPVEGTLTFSALSSALADYDAVLFCSEQGGIPIRDAVSRIDTKRIAVVVGSEGGFSQVERETLSALSSAYTVTLGKRILRAETASVFVLSVLTALKDC